MVTPIVPGNIDLSQRRVFFDQDGSPMTVRSMSFGTENGQEVLIPTVHPIEGRIMSPTEAFDYYEQTGEHLGIFASPQDATEFSQSISTAQDQRYGFDQMPATLEQDTQDFLSQRGIQPANDREFQDYMNHLAVNPQLRPSYAGQTGLAPDYASVRDLDSMAQTSVDRSEGTRAPITPSSNYRMGSQPSSYGLGGRSANSPELSNPVLEDSSEIAPRFADLTQSTPTTVPASTLDPSAVTRTIDPVTGNIVDDSTGEIISYGNPGGLERATQANQTNSPALRIPEIDIVNGLPLTAPNSPSPQRIPTQTTSPAQRPIGNNEPLGDALEAVGDFIGDDLGFNDELQSAIDYFNGNSSGVSAEQWFQGFVGGLNRGMTREQALNALTHLQQENPEMYRQVATMIQAIQ